jgi:hypothetical protein
MKAFMCKKTGKETESLQHQVPAMRYDYHLTRRRFASGLALTALGFTIGRLFGEDKKSPSVVLIIGDSMALCGFGKRLDGKFRKSDHPKVFTYMACGTNPLSWTKIHPYTNVRTVCGLWTLESQEDGSVKEFQDTYGMSRGRKPSPHPVPKLEDLLEAIHPDLLIVQLGNNLLDLPMGNKGNPGGVFDPYIRPFLDIATPKVGRVVWVTPPVSGSISKEKQDQLVQHIQSYPAKNLSVIDSRNLLTYPYSHLQADKQHFMGKDMDLWADKVFDAILIGPPTPVASMPAISAAPVSTPAPRPKKKKLIKVRALLEKITPPFSKEETAPYYKCLVEEIYKVVSSSEKSLNNQRIAVLRIYLSNEKRLRLGGAHSPRSKNLKLVPLEDSLLATWKCRRDARYVELSQFVSADDDYKVSSSVE